MYRAPRPTMPATLSALALFVLLVGALAGAPGSDADAQALVPAVGGINPSAGPSTGGTTVTITGSNLTNKQGGPPIVMFGTAAAGGVSCTSSTSCTAVSPAGTGSVHVTVTTAYGTSAPTPADLFTYQSVNAATWTLRIPGPAVTAAAQGLATGRTFSARVSQLASAQTAANRTRSASVGPRNGVTSPGPRSGAGAAADPTTGAVVMFGGISDCGCTLDETWVWQNNAWTQKNPATVPPERSNQAMAFHAGTGLTVMFGGSQIVDLPTFALGDTWTWNGTNWTQVFPPSSPSARTDATMAYDPAHDVIVLFGGIDTSGTTLNDTWTWTGSTWTLQSPATKPPARTFAGMADSQVTGFAVLFGGFDADFNGLGDTWLWSGSNWIQQFPASSPSPRGVMAMGSDRQGLQVLLFGGATDCLCVLGDTWTWEPAPATPVVTSVTPPNGPAQGGSKVVVDGSGFSTAPGGSIVRFGAQQASDVQCISSTRCYVISPPGSGTVHVTVTVNGRTSATSPADQFTYLSPTPTPTPAPTPTPKAAPRTTPTPTPRATP